MQQVASFTTNDFDFAELDQIIAVAGLRTEHFLRTAVVPDISPKQDLAAVINALKSLGVSKEQRESLHRLRELYNWHVYGRGT